MSDSTDFYHILGLPHTAVLDEETLHRAYVEKSRSAHPDHGGEEIIAAYANAAYETLRAPERRLKHLLELDAPEDAKAWRTVPMDDAMMSLFSKLGKALEDSGKFLERKTKAQSALAKALLANEEMRQREVLEAIGFEIENQKSQMEATLPAVDEGLRAGDPAVWKQIGIAQARFAYLIKWQTQLRERLLALM